MKVLILNGSPRQGGTVATLLRSVAEGLEGTHDIDWVDVYELDIAPCVGCMKCRPDGACVLSEDDGHTVGRRIRDADGLVVGTPIYWGNMSGPLKLLFDRNVPVFMGESPRGIPAPRQKGKPAAVVAACTTPWPFNSILPQSRGAVRAIGKVLHYGGYRILGKIVKPGTKKAPELSDALLAGCRRLGHRF